MLPVSYDDKLWLKVSFCGTFVRTAEDFGKSLPEIFLRMEFSHPDFQVLLRPWKDGFV